MSSSSGTKKNNPNGMLARGTIAPLRKYPRTSARPVATGANGELKLEDAVRTLSRRMTAMALATLGNICENGKNESARVQAAREILDRAWGKAHIIAEAETRPGSDIHVHFGDRPTLTVKALDQIEEDLPEDE